MFPRQANVYGSDALGPDDILVIRLPSSAPKGYRRIKYYEGPTLPAAPSSTVIGYGNTALDQPDAEKERRFGTILSANISISGPGTRYHWARSDWTETGIMKGDSGGPLLFQAGNALLIAGVASEEQYGGQYPSIGGLWTIVANHRTWLDQITGTPENDSDQDAQPDSCDNCAAANGANPDQLDSDGDGIGDVCDSCPDNDLDGVCGQNDNCPTVPNPGQENCNLDAELDRGAAVLGDACDPVPCPKFTAPVHTPVPISSTIDGCTHYKITRDLRNIIRAKPIASFHPVSGAQGATSTNVETRYRFCQRDLAKSRTCAINDQQRRDQQFEIAFVPGVPTSGYFETTIAGLSGGVGSIDYPSANESTRAWDYWSDRAAWISSQWMTDPGTAQIPQGQNDLTYTASVSGLNGFFGLRGRWQDLLGTSTNNSNGVHPSPQPGGEPQGARLARHYEEISPDAFVEDGPWSKCFASCTGPCFDVDHTAVLRWCHHCAKRPVGWMYPSQPFDYLLAKNSSGGWGHPTPSGTMQDPTGFVGADVLSSLSSSALRFVQAAEPYAAQGSTTASAQSVFAYADGRGIDSAVVATNDGFVFDRSIQLHSGIPGRSGAAFVYSRALGALAVVGGEISGNQTNEIWMHRIGVGTEQLTVLGYHPEHVLAAQAGDDGTLWVLDTPRAGLNERRLVRIQVANALAHVVWSGVREGGFTQYSLRVDRDGSMLLFSANATDYCTLRWRAMKHDLGTEEAILMRNDSGALRGVPSVHPGGYQFLLQVNDQVERIDVTDLIDQFGGSPPVSRCL